jgi:hypothetical protein
VQGVRGHAINPLLVQEIRVHHRQVMVDGSYGKTFVSAVIKVIVRVVSGTHEGTTSYASAFLHYCRLSTELDLTIRKQEC